VDRLQGHGVLIVEHDPADGRRTLVSVDPKTRRLDFSERAERPIADAIRRLTGVNGEQLLRVEAALEVLGEELLARVRQSGSPASADDPDPGE
jgi:DNA-binding MarR family transcriptional regulator